MNITKQKKKKKEKKTDLPYTTTDSNNRAKRVTFVMLRFDIMTRKAANKFHNFAHFERADNAFGASF